MSGHTPWSQIHHKNEGDVHTGYRLEIVAAARETLAEIATLDDVPTPHLEHEAEACSSCDAYRLLAALVDAANAVGRNDKPTIAAMLNGLEQLASSERPS